MTQTTMVQRRMISGQAALTLLRDIGASLDGVLAPRVSGSDDQQRAADAALQSAVDGHDVRNWDSLDLDIRSELARRWLILAAECSSFGDASMLSLPWGTTDRVVRDLLLSQMMHTPAPASSLAA